MKGGRSSNSVTNAGATATVSFQQPFALTWKQKLRVVGEERRLELELLQGHCGGHHQATEATLPQLLL